MAQPEQISYSLTDTVNGKDVMDPSQYERIHSGGVVPNPSSINWGIVAVGVDAWRCQNGLSSIWTVRQSLDWVLSWLLWQEEPGVGHGAHHEVRSGIYIRYMAPGVRALRALAILHGRDDVRDACDRWYRCYLGISALLAIRADPANLTDAEQEAAQGPGTITATHPGPWPSPLTVADCGGRSFSTNHAMLLLCSNFSERDLAEALGLREAGGLSHALWARRPDLAAFPVSEEDKLAMSACLYGNVEAARYVSEEIVGTYPCPYDYTILRWGGNAAQSVMHRYGGSSTAPSMSKLCQPGRTDVLVCDPGGRDSGGDDWDVGASTAVINESEWTVTASRNDGRFPPATMPLYPGSPSFRAVWSPTGVEILVPAPVVPPPPPPPDPVPDPQSKPEKKRLNPIIFIVAVGILALVAIIVQAIRD